MSEPWVITIALIAVALICYIVSSCLQKEEKTILRKAAAILGVEGIETNE